MRLRTRSGTLVASMAVLSALGCGGARPSSPGWHGAEAERLDHLRSAGRSSSDGEAVGRWALAEMFAPGGTSAQAAEARRRLRGMSAAQASGTWASLARGIFDDEHGEPKSAADAYVDALRASARGGEPEDPIVAWFAVRRLVSLRSSNSGLFERVRPTLEEVMARPGAIGWRAVADLEEWRALEVYDRAAQSGKAYDEDIVRRMGCARHLRVAGPFGHGAAADALRSFAPESASSWPPAWAPDPIRGTVPHVLSVVQNRCLAVPDEQVEEGVFYIQSFFTTHGPRELVVAAQGSIALWVDGALVATRSADDWGSWQRFGVHLSVADGRHRVVAKTVTPGGSIRLLNADGTAAGIPADDDAGPAFTIEAPTVLADPNPIDALVQALAAGAPPSALAPVDTALAAFAAGVDDLDDVGSALVAPLVDPPDAAAVALEMAAPLAAGDPAWPDDARGTRARALRQRALERDAGLWRARLASILDGVSEHGLSDAIEPLEQLARDVPRQPEPLEQLARVYGRLGWVDAQLRTLDDLVRRFPEDAGALRALLDAVDQNGSVEQGDAIAVRLKDLQPESDVLLDRALARHDYAAAIRELEAVRARRPDRRDVTDRLVEVLARSGRPEQAAAQLETVLAKQPRDAQARFRLADRAYAAGDASALRKALASALQAGASTDDLRAAIDLVEGATDLEPFRKDGQAVIANFRAWERAGHHMDGTSARVLDYAAVWVHGDGSSDMLEHEIQKIQSQEAIQSESETPPPEGLVLHLRVIKPDGRVLEPEPVSGKPTLTLPHVEVGDFVEIEHITSQSGDGSHGRHYRSPQWFFREADKGYWQSEFVVVTPADHALEIDARGQVPAPEVTPLGPFVVHRWRTELSPPAELEPDGPPITEFLPSVRVGWGLTFESTLARLADAAVDDTPLDPRLRALAYGIVRGIPATAIDERARRLYRWVLENVREGKETDGRRVLDGRSGVRQPAFRYLLRLLGIESELALVKDRLALPASGGLREIEAYDAVALRLTTEKGVRWLTVRDKFAPYGYVPAEWRDQPAIRLVPGAPRDTVHATGATDGIVYEGRAEMHDDGSAVCDLTLTFEGNRAIAWRSALDQIAQAKLYDFVERELVAPAFDGGHVRDMTVEQARDLDAPLVMRLRVDVPQMAKNVGNGLSLHPPFAPPLAQLAALPRRHTPLVRRASFRAEVRVRVDLPPAIHPPARMLQGEIHEGQAFVAVRDEVHGASIDFVRVIDVPAGRVAPGDEYAAWQKFAQSADALVTRDVPLAR